MKENAALVHCSNVVGDSVLEWTGEDANYLFDEGMDNPHQLNDWPFAEDVKEFVFTKPFWGLFIVEWNNPVKEDAEDGDDESGREYTVRQLTQVEWNSFMGGRPIIDP